MPARVHSVFVNATTQTRTATCPHTDPGLAYRQVKRTWGTDLSARATAYSVHKYGRVTHSGRCEYLRRIDIHKYAKQAAQAGNFRLLRDWSQMMIEALS